MTKILKRPLSIILAVLMVMSLFVSVPMTANAYNVVDDGAIDTIQATQEEDNLAKVYFQMPNGKNGPVDGSGNHTPSWKNDYNKASDGKYYPGIFWWDAEASPASQPGYRMSIDDYDNSIYYAYYVGDGHTCHLRFNNGVDSSTGKFAQTAQLNVEGAYADDYDYLYEDTYNEFDMNGCIFVVDPNSASCDGFWYFYYGNGCYGNYRTDSGEFVSATANCVNPDHFVNGEHVGYHEDPTSTYTVTWKNGNTTIETDTDVAEGETPSYNSETPTKATDDNYTYTFSGWSDGTNTYGLNDTLPTVSSDVIFTAQFTATPVPDPQTHDGVTFNAWTAADSLPASGNWYLNSDVTVSSTTDVSDTLNLCLNGHSVLMTGNGGVFHVLSGATMNLYDCNGSDSDHYVTLNNWRGTAVSDTGTEQTVTDGSGVVKVTGGLITGGYAGNPGGGAFRVDGTLNMYGGTLIGNYTLFSTNKGSGGAIWTGGSTTIAGNTRITYNKGSEGNRGGVYVSSGTFNISGAPDLTGNSGCDVVLNGSNTKINFTDFDSDVRIGVVYVTGNPNDVVITSGADFADYAEIQAAMSHYSSSNRSIVWMDGEAKIGTPYTVTWKNGDTVIETDTGVAAGATPIYNGTTPEKAEDETNTYTFSGWSPAIAPVSADVTYTAQFTATPKHTEHTYTANPTFNWTQDASTGDWTCDTLTLSCTCGDSQDYPVTGFFGASVVTCTANADGSFTYSVSKKVDGVTYSDTKTLEANSVVKSATQLKAAAKQGGSWDLGNDVDQVVGISCADGFELDGNGYTVTRHSNVATNPVFVAANKNASFALMNLTIDGIADQTEVRPAIASAQTNGNSGNVIDLYNVKIVNWDFDQTNNGAVLAWGQATVNMENCDIRTDSNYDVWGGAASTVNVDGGKVGKVYLNAGTAQATVANGAQVDNIVAFAGNTITADSGSNITPPADYKVKDNGDGTYSIVPKEYVAQVNDGQKYETLAEAITAAADGDTITILDDIDLGTSKINVKKSVNFDLGGKKITGSGAAIFVVYPNKTVSIENGTIENTATTSNHYTIVGNASTVNLGDGAKLAGGYQTYSGAAGAVLNVNEGSTIENTTSFGAAIYNNAVLNVNGGTIKAAVPITTLGTSGNGGYEINISAGTVESTDEIAIYHVNAGELNITGGTIKGGSEAALLIKSGTTEISGGTFTSDGEAVKYDSTGSGYAALDKIEISGGTFSNDVDIYAAPGYVGTQLSATTFGVKVDTNPLGKAPIIGFQKKAADDKYAQGVRIVTKVGGCDLTQFDEYGYVVVKVTGKQQASANFNNMKAYGGNGEKTIKCNGTVNTIDGLGTPYVTLAVNGMTDGQQVAARFYAIKDGVTYYSNYVSTARYNGIIATY